MSDTRRWFMISVALICFIGVSATITQPGLTQEYLLGPGDVVDIVVFGDSDLTRTVTIRADGMISLPLVGEIPSLGLTPSQLADKIAGVLKPYFKEPRVTVTLSQARPVKVYLVGEVKSPGSYDMKPGWTVVEAIAQAGGLTEKANLKKSVLIRRTANTVIPLDLDRLILKGDQSANFSLAEGDVIQVPEFRNRVLVLGRVKTPGAFDLKEGGRVLDAILAAGGPDEKARLENVGIIRQVEGKATVTNVNVARVTQSGDLSGNILLTHTDIVYVPQRGIAWQDIVRWIVDLTIVRSFFGF
jgi:polysaccharide export outer membrane protein